MRYRAGLWKVTKAFPLTPCGCEMAAKTVASVVLWVLLSPALISNTKVKALHTSRKLEATAQLSATGKLVKSLIIICFRICDYLSDYKSLSMSTLLENYGEIALSPWIRLTNSSALWRSSAYEKDINVLSWRILKKNNFRKSLEPKPKPKLITFDIHWQIEKVNLEQLFRVSQSLI